MMKCLKRPPNLTPAVSQHGPEPVADGFAVQRRQHHRHHSAASDPAAAASLQRQGFELSLVPSSLPLPGPLHRVAVHRFDRNL